MRMVLVSSCSSLVEEDSGVGVEAVGREHTEVLGRVDGRVVVVVGSKGQQVVVGNGAQVVGSEVPVGNEALGKAVGM